MRNSLHWMLDDGEQASTEAKHLVGMVGNGGGHYGHIPFEIDRCKTCFTNVLC